MKDLREAIQEIRAAELPYYVYVLYKPTYKPFYVGKGTSAKFCDSNDERICWHEYEAKNVGRNNFHTNKHKVNTIRQIWKTGKHVLYAIDSWHDEELKAYERERELILSIGRRVDDTGPLTNIEEGGEKSGGVSPEVRAKISDSLKQYYFENPDARAANGERKKRYFAEHPEARERMRQHAIKHDTGARIRQWCNTHPDEVEVGRVKMQRSKKQWYIDNPEAATELAERRNEVLRSDRHRQKMSERTKDFIRNNPDADTARRKKANATMQQTMAEFAEIKQKCLWIIHDRLLLRGEIEPFRGEFVSNKMVWRWRQRGLLEKHFPTMPKGRVKENWLNFYKELTDE